MRPHEEFVDLLAADKRAEKRIFWGELTVLAGVLALLALRLWFVLRS